MCIFVNNIGMIKIYMSATRLVKSQIKIVNTFTQSVLSDYLP